MQAAFLQSPQPHHFLITLHLGSGEALLSLSAQSQKPGSAVQSARSTTCSALRERKSDTNARKTPGLLRSSADQRRTPPSPWASAGFSLLPYGSQPPSSTSAWYRHLKMLQER